MKLSLDVKFCYSSLLIAFDSILYVQELQILNEKYILEKRIAQMRLVNNQTLYSRFQVLSFPCEKYYIE